VQLVRQLLGQGGMGGAHHHHNKHLARVKLELCAHLVRQLLGEGGQGDAHHRVRLAPHRQVLQLRLERAALQCGQLASCVSVLFHLAAAEESTARRRGLRINIKIDIIIAATTAQSL
jgi:hypothetical protein